MKRTDLALELLPSTATHCLKNGVKRTRVVLDQSLAQRYGKPKGKYITVESDAVVSGESAMYNSVAKVISNELKLLFNNVSSVCVVGLGNPGITADSLGSRVAARLKVTRHCGKDQQVKLSVITPNVLGVTGIESADVTRGVCGITKPDLVIVIDSLASAAVGRIGTAFQLSDTGITPGSGVSNHRLPLNNKTLGTPVISMGVPLVVYASTIIEDATGSSSYDQQIGNMIVTPKDIDSYVDGCAEIIAKAINLAFFA